MPLDPTTAVLPAAVAPADAPPVPEDPEEAAAVPVLQSLVDIPNDVFPRIARHLNLADVCALRATCRTMAHCSAILAAECIPEVLPYVVVERGEV